MKKHLTDNKVDLKDAHGRVGVKLTIDPKTEQIAGNKPAGDMLFREYRKSFDITEAV